MIQVSSCLNSLVTHPSGYREREGDIWPVTEEKVGRLHTCGKKKILGLPHTGQVLPELIGYRERRGLPGHQRSNKGLPLLAEDIGYREMPACWADRR